MISTNINKITEKVYHEKKLHLFVVWQTNGKIDNLTNTIIVKIYVHFT